MKVVFDKIEEYQEITGQEGEHIDKLKLYVKCYFIKSKFFNDQDKAMLSQGILKILQCEFNFCELTFNHDGIDIITDINNIIVRNILGA
ncbi:hypothetical protein C9J12_19240 [Photobacterium frigidiphilum]|uniref:Uncharacterized protein n=1 Tax=Photobacterium frigidiphilum TaxID=264736 RepID=A0A2T3JBH4_9GAMM|nr:hypothetical protein [Photobacterium frigidiphilum]PSU46207.1 hypothetical protein C9J12_19240 [Photobacterium frigidiphilum]